MPGMGYVSDRIGDEYNDESYGMTLVDLERFIQMARRKGVPDHAQIGVYPNMDALHQVAAFYEVD